MLPPPIPVRLTVIPDHDCPYLPGRVSRTRAFLASSLPAGVYHQFMDANFRRSGELFYQPICPGCNKCRQIRIPVERFAPSRSQRRCARRNADLRVSVGAAVPTDEKFDLYRRYIARRHALREAVSRQSFEEFLYTSPVDTLEFTYRDPAGRLVAVGICDVCELSLSSVYFYFDPGESRRGPGTFGALWEIAWARRNRIPFYYLGYWVEDCPTMHYKSFFRPCQVLEPDGEWRERA